MKKALLIAAMLIALPAAAGNGGSALSPDATFRERLYERYCEKLRESPEAYVQFVRRLKPVHGFTYSDFAPEPGMTPRADCRVAPARVAAVYRVLGQSRG